jgi:TetR/AcrR family transcriptional regulator, transcriptional repressor for nem operon
MNNKTSRTRERILNEAEQCILRQGFNSTNIEDILQQAAITKSGFFYHFSGKQDLAKALVNRYLATDEELFNNLFARADSLTEDPLQRLLLFLKLFAETMQALELTHPGCLVVTFTYESYQGDGEIRDLVQGGVLGWRKLIKDRLEPIVRSKGLPEAFELEDLADMFTSCVEGGILLSRMFQSNHHLVQQILLYRDYLRRLFGAV